MDVQARLEGSSERGFNQRQAHFRLALIAHATGDMAEQAKQARWVLATLQDAPNARSCPKRWVNWPLRRAG